MVVGLLALLAVAGVFLIFGLLSGFLRLGDRAAEADMIKAVADGFDSALQIVNAQGSVLYRNRALQRFTGRASGRHASLEELFAGEADTAQAYFRLSRAAERRRSAKRKSTCIPVRSGAAAGAGSTCPFAPFRTPAGGNAQ